MEKKKTKSGPMVKRSPLLKKTAITKGPAGKIGPESEAYSVVLNKLKPPAGAHKKKKLLGRGPGSGHGKTSTRGSKGQTSRAGRHFYLGFEGGQSPLIRKMPKRGFVSNFKKTYQVVNLQELNKIKETVITPELLQANGLIRDKRGLVKVLGNGSIKKALTVSAHAFSKRAAQEIVSCGGKAELIPPHS